MGVFIATNCKKLAFHEGSDVSSSTSERIRAERKAREFTVRI